MPSPSTERGVIKKCVTYAKARGAMHIRLTLRAGPSRGIPDHVFLGNGNMFFVEFKKPGGATSKIQEHVIGKIRNAGVPVMVCDNFDDFRKHLSRAGIWSDYDHTGKIKHRLGRR